MAINFKSVKGPINAQETIFTHEHINFDDTSTLDDNLSDFYKNAGKPDFYKIGKFSASGSLGGTYSGKQLLEDSTKFTAAVVMKYLYEFASGKHSGSGATFEIMATTFFGVTRTQMSDATLGFLSSYNLATNRTNKAKIVDLKNASGKVREAYRDIFLGGNMSPTADKSIASKISAIDGFSSPQDFDEKFLRAMAYIIIAYLGIFSGTSSQYKDDELLGTFNPDAFKSGDKLDGNTGGIRNFNYPSAPGRYMLLPNLNKITGFRTSPQLTMSMIKEALLRGSLGTYNMPKSQTENLGHPAAGGAHHFRKAIEIIVSYIEPFADIVDAADLEDDGTGWTGPGIDAGELKDLQAIGNALEERPQLGENVEKAQKEMQENIKQCILLAGMGELSKLSIQLRTGKVTQRQQTKATYATANAQANPPASAYTIGVTPSQYKVGYPWGGRIIPLSVLPQEYYLNSLNLPPAKTLPGKGIEVSINDYLQATSLYKNGLEIKFGLFKVVENFYDARTGKLVQDGKPIDLPIRFDKGWPDWYGAPGMLVKTGPPNPKLGVNPFFNSLDDTRKEIYKKRIKDGKKMRLPESFIIFKKCDVKFKGGNPATAKSDVQVSMEFFVKDIKYIEQAFSNKINLGGYKYVNNYRVAADPSKEVHYKFSILDLISYVKQNNSKTGFGSAYRDQYHPNYNRLILKSVVQHVPPSSDGSESPQMWREINELLMDHPLILDLALVDHELKKNEFNNSVTINIEYRGYIDSILSDPIMDCLQGSSEVALNIMNEIKFLIAADEGCSVEQLQNVERGFAELRRQSMAKILPRIWDSLDKRNKIFRFSMDIDEVLESLNATKSRITNPEPILKRARMTLGPTAALWHRMNAVVTDPNATPADKTKASETFAKLVKTDPDNVIKFKKTWEVLYEMSQQSTAAPPPAKQSAQQKKNKKLVQNKPIARGGAEKENFSDLDFFFFGDLIDVLMDAQHTYPGGDDQIGYSMRNVPDQTFAFPPAGIKYNAKSKRKVGKNDLLKAAKSFRYMHRPPPTKVILPTFNWFLPNKVGTLPPVKEYRTNLADVPISVHWFLRWFKEEILDKNLQYYSVMGMIRALSSTLITRLLNEVCFAPGSQRKVLFRASADYGLFDWNRVRKTAKANEEANIDPLVRGFIGGHPAGSGIPSTVKLNKYGEYSIVYSKKKGKMNGTLPLLRKGFNNHVDEYCNYIIVYVANQQGFETTVSVGAGVDHAKYGVPHFTLRGIRPQRRAKQLNKHLPRLYGYTQENTVVSMIDKIDFKKKDAPYRREAKFFASNRGNLAQIAGVYNATITLSAPAFFLYPGQICWVDAGLADRPNNPKSIAFELGLGGYYQIVQVNHKFDTIDGKSPIGFTVVEAVWVNYGVKNERTRIAATFKQIGKNPIKLKVNKNAKCDEIIKEIDAALSDYERILESVRNAQSLAAERAVQQAMAQAAANAANNQTGTGLPGATNNVPPVVALKEGSLDIQAINMTNVEAGVLKLSHPNLPTGVTLSVESAMNPPGANNKEEEEQAKIHTAHFMSHGKFADGRAFRFDTEQNSGSSMLPVGNNPVNAQLTCKGSDGKTYRILYDSNTGDIHMIVEGKDNYNSRVHQISGALNGFLVLRGS